AALERLAAKADTQRPRKHFRQDRENACAPRHYPLPLRERVERGRREPAAVRVRAAFRAELRLGSPRSPATAERLMAIVPPRTFTSGTVAASNGSNSVCAPSAGLSSIRSPAPKLWIATTVPHSLPASSTARSPIKSAW